VKDDDIAHDAARDRNRASKAIREPFTVPSTVEEP
jgi:hypothetical protein